MSNNNNESRQEKSLKMVNVFSKHQSVFGLPSHVFGMGAGISIVVFFLLSKIMAIIFVIVFFSVMFSIHEEDPKGFDVWRRVLFQGGSGWSASKVKSVKLIILK
jgi:type IV secretory pathway VirB3-like protein